MNYIDLSYESGEDDLVASFYLEPAEGLTLEKASGHVAAESSIGTWTDLKTMKPEIAQRLKPTVFEINKESNVIKIAYPSELFESGNMPQILSSVAGNIFGMKSVKNLRLMDLAFPESIAGSFKGPGFGIKGVRRILGIKKRPLVGTIVKPKIGLDPEGHARVAYDSWIGGCDIVKDDENLTSQDFNPFGDRVIQTLEMRDKAEKETGEKKIYMPNVTAETREMIQRAEFVRENGCEYVMIDIVTAGFSALQSLREDDLGLVIHAHRAMHAAFTRNKSHGISMLVLAKLSRIVGVDQLHIGTAVGKMEGSGEEVVGIKNAITRECFNLKPVFPVCSGGLHPGLVPQLVEIFGGDIIIQMGGGIHGHPKGTKAGALAARESIEAVMQGIPLEDYALDYEGLGQALKKWGRN
ncbi:MAG: type III ribulose-bisphosphate carboxylase [Candidatus Altiarchaeota archaeon]|nr:type III ribulose-bisphosphate carboxylase [Candidatus Altiarchaeota archaeon]